MKPVISITSVNAMDLVHSSKVTHHQIIPKYVESMKTLWNTMNLQDIDDFPLLLAKEETKWTLATKHSLAPDTKTNSTGNTQLLAGPSSSRLLFQLVLLPQSVSGYGAIGLVNSVKSVWVNKVRYI